MMTEALDFQTESESLATLLEDMNDAAFAAVTQFKQWQVNDILQHLHVWNKAARMTLLEPDMFVQFYAAIAGELRNGTPLRQAEQNAGVVATGKELFSIWREECESLASTFASADPDHRVKWGGPDMGVRTCIIARQMETWSHGQAVFDLLGHEREDTDRLRNITHLGVQTYGWTFRNRGLEAPTPKPYVELTSPGGATWQWNEPQPDNLVSGKASHFCQVVTQTRNIADTDLSVRGDPAKHWMQIAQCFAGPAESPPEPGSRHLRI